MSVPNSQAKKDTVPLLPPCWAWGSKVWHTQVSSPCGIQNDWQGPCTTHTCQSLHPQSQGLTPADKAGSHASQQNNLETQVGH